MGIFDDAIREHLELKRQKGVDEDELKELEDEAFGPPARPGDPDFPGSTNEVQAVESPAEAPAASVERPAEEASAEAREGASTEGAPTSPFQRIEELESEPDRELIADAPVELEPEPVAAAPVEPAPVAPAPAEPPPEPIAEAPAEPEPEAPESAAETTEFQAGDEAGSTESASAFTTAEREAIADQPTVFFDQAPASEPELGDLDLDLDEEIEEVGGSVDDPPAVSDPPAREEPLAVEEAFTGDPPAGEAAPPVTPEPSAADAEVPEAQEPGTSEEDVLEETPEFLRDNPDDDELWFEQGEPKDFDF